MKKIHLINGRNISIEILIGDITRQEVDVIVNAAHEKLEGGGGVDGAIHRAAGQSLIQECREIEQVEPGIRCRVGEAHITSGGNLIAKHVIHTVAPKFVGSVTNGVYKSINPDIDNELSKCYINCIILASLHNLKSIAFPSLGTGGHSYPIELASDIAIRTTLEALKCSGTISNVKFICYSRNDYDTYVCNYENLRENNNGKI
jgi:O-acetyl-ADP-ribose deacetylase